MEGFDARFVDEDRRVAPGVPGVESYADGPYIPKRAEDVRFRMDCERLESSEGVVAPGWVISCPVRGFRSSLAGVSFGELSKDSPMMNGRVGFGR